MAMTNEGEEAATLIYKAMAINSGLGNDAEYRYLLAKYRSERDFAALVKGIARGLELVILDVSERGLVIAPTGKESRFSLKLSDLRTTLNENQKVAMVLVHLAIGTVFYPTADFLDDDGRTPFPATVKDIRERLLVIARNMERASDGDSYQVEQMRPGWSMVLGLVPAIPDAQRAALSSVDGIVRFSLMRMKDFGLVRSDTKAEITEKTSFTPTHQFRIQLRKLTLPLLFPAAVEAAIAQDDRR
jgi:hypothetical protein